MLVIVGSHNPVKNEAVKSAFKKVFPIDSIEITKCTVSSGVSDQPMTDQETLRGATNRSSDCKLQHPDADFWVGLEGGCQFEGEDLEAYAWMVILSSTGMGKARTSSFILPEKVARLVKSGVELGEADDMVFKRSGSKQKNGAVGILTRNLIDRASYYEQALILALIPFINSDLYQQK